MVGATGVEPARISPKDPKSFASANSATRPDCQSIFAAAGTSVNTFCSGALAFVMSGVDRAPESPSEPKAQKRPPGVNLPDAASGLVNPHAVEKQPSASGVGVRVGDGACEPGDVCGRQREQRGQISAPLKRIVHPEDALPTHRDIGPSRCRRKHAQYRERVDGGGATDPLLPVVHAVRIRIGKIRRAVRGQVVPLQPDYESAADARLELVGSYIHRAPDDARAAVKVGAGGRVGIVPGIDARGVGSQPQVAGVSHESLVARPGVVQGAGGVVIGEHSLGPCRVVMQDAVIEPAAIRPPTHTIRGCSRVVGQSAVVELAMTSPAAKYAAELPVSVQL